MSTYWQIATGSDQRNYADDFFKYGIAFVGDKKHVDRILQVQPGDYVIAKSGKKILAVGQVVSRDGKHSGDRDKKWLLDYDGWELPGYCHVNWHKLPEPMPCKELTRGTIGRVNSPAIREVIATILGNPQFIMQYDVEPAPTYDVSLAELAEYAAAQGKLDKEKLLASLQHLKELTDYYYNSYYEGGIAAWRELREHEIRTFLVVPLLLALGWSEKQLKIEYTLKGGRVDIACFSTPYFSPNRQCRILIETKALSEGLLLADGQVKNYATQVPSCDLAIITNGYCYKAYQRIGDTFSDKPTAYLNLRHPQDRYPLNPAIYGAAELLELLLPVKNI